MYSTDGVCRASAKHYQTLLPAESTIAKFIAGGGFRAMITFDLHDLTTASVTDPISKASSANP
jgi:hypothetical protein